MRSRPVGLILAAPTVAISIHLVRELRDSGFFGSGSRHAVPAADTATVTEVDDRAGDGSDDLAAEPNPPV